MSLLTCNAKQQGIINLKVNISTIILANYKSMDFLFNFKINFQIIILLTSKLFIITGFKYFLFYVLKKLTCSQFALNIDSYPSKNDNLELHLFKRE